MPVLRLVEIPYQRLQLGLTRQLGRAIELEADYLRLDRADGFLGYYDYTQDVLRVRFGFDPFATLANAGSCLCSSVNPRCVV